MTTGLLRRTNVASISKRMRLRQSFIWDPSLVLYLPLWNDKFISLDYNQHVCTNTGSVLVPNRGRSFDGTDNTIRVAHNAAFNFAGGDFTWEFWVNRTTSSSKRLISKTPSWAVSFNAPANTIFFRVRQDVDNLASITSVLTATPGNWSHIFAIKRGSAIELYVDNVLDTAVPTYVGLGASSNIDSATDMHIASEDGIANWLDATVGEARIYNRALTVGERLRNYQATKWRFQ